LTTQFWVTKTGAEQNGADRDRQAHHALCQPSTWATTILVIAAIWIRAHYARKCRAVMGPATFEQTPKGVVQRLWRPRKTITARARRVATFLLAWYNAEEGVTMKFRLSDACAANPENAYSISTMGGEKEAKLRPFGVRSRSAQLQECPCRFGS
jgi:hypothetical protein